MSLVIPDVPNNLIVPVRALARSAALLGSDLAAMGEGMTWEQILDEPARWQAVHAATVAIQAWCAALGIDAQTLQDLE
jgi:hypothetical protein